MKYFKISLIFSALWLAVFFGFKDHAGADDSYDLQAESLTMDSAKCEVNKICTFTAKVKNLGSEFILNFSSKASAVSADLTGSQIALSPAQGTVIPTNDYLTFFISGYYRKIGSVTLNFSVNSAGYLTETNTNNNSASLAVNVLGYDLAAETITILPAKPMINQLCYIQVKVKNYSSYNLYDGSGLDSVKIFPDFVVADASSTQPSLSNTISSGGYLYYGFEGKFTASGEKQLSFTVDSDNALKESDSANNLKTAIATVYNPADTDLAIDSVSYSTDKIISGQPFDITIGIKNIGKTYLTDSSGLGKDEFTHNLAGYVYGLYDLTPDIYPTLSAPFNPGDIFHYKFHGIFGQSGSLNLTFAINQKQRLIESNTNNNSSSTAVIVYKSQADADSFSVLSKNLSFVSSTSVIISWKTDVKTTGALNYNQADFNIYGHQLEAAEALLEHSITLDKLRPGADYIYSITAKNGTVEKTETASSFFTPPDDALKLVSGPSVSVSDKNATFAWGTNLISSSRVYYKKTGTADLSVTGSDTATAEHQIEIKGLALGQYDYFLSSTSTPNTNFKTGWSSFEIKAVPVTPPATATVSANAVSAAAAYFPITNSSLYEKLKGKIILRVESKGEAYYISPKDKKMYSLGRPAEAFQVVRNQAVGMTNANLAKIPVGLSALSGADADSDGLPDAFETALGTDINQSDTDGDGYNDKDEITSGNSPLEKNRKLVFDYVLTRRFKGQILLQVQGRGQAWYLNPADQKRYFLNRPADAFNIMRKLGLGVTNANYQAMGGK